MKLLEKNGWLRNNNISMIKRIPIIIIINKNVYLQYDSHPT